MGANPGETQLTPPEPDAPQATHPTALWTGVSTAAIHAGEARQRAHDSITTPIVQASTYTFTNTAELIEYHEGRLAREEYGRYGNPTVRAAEAKLAALEGGTNDSVATLLCASGMNAVTTVLLAMLPAGSHLVLTDDCYRRTRQFVRTMLTRLGVHHTVVPACDYAAIEAAIQPKTRLIVSESPTNPYLRVLDLPRLVAIAKQHRVKPSSMQLLRRHIIFARCSMGSISSSTAQPNTSVVTMTCLPEQLSASPASSLRCAKRRACLAVSVIPTAPTCCCVG